MNSVCHRIAHSVALISEDYQSGRISLRSYYEQLGYLQSKVRQLQVALMVPSNMYEEFDRESYVYAQIIDHEIGGMLAATENLHDSFVYAAQVAHTTGDDEHVSWVVATYRKVFGH